MELKTLDEIYALPVFAEYKVSEMEHFFIYIQDQQQYALVSHSGVLFDDYKFVEDADIFNSVEADLNKYVSFIEDSLGPVIKIPSNASMASSKATSEDVKPHLNREEILESNEYFSRYKRTIEKKLFWSETLEKYYLVTEKGGIFEDGVFYTREEALHLKNNPPSKETLRAIHSFKLVFGWDHIKLLD
jgi:hypothetical protein